jgi:hypothetical protein
MHLIAFLNHLPIHDSWTTRAKTQSEMVGFSLEYSQEHTFDEVNKSAAFPNLEAKKAPEHRMFA